MTKDSKTVKSSRGRPKTVKPEAMVDSETRDRLLRVCDDLAVIFKARAALDKRSRYQKFRQYAARRTKRAESDLANFEKRLLRILPALEKLVRKTQDELIGFGGLMRGIRLQPYPNEQLSDSLFGLDDDFWYNTTVDNLFEPSNKWIYAEASTALAKYFQKATTKDIKTNLFYCVVEDLGCSEKELQNKIDSTQDISSPVKRADTVVAKIIKVEADAVRKYRRKHRRNPS